MIGAERRSSVFVLGNAAGVALTRFAEVTSIGTKASFLHWQRIGWYPTHYCCIDEEVIATHHEAIRDMVVKGLVESAFVTAGILEFYPYLQGDSRFVFVDSYVRTPAFDTRADRFGLPRLSHPAFSRFQTHVGPRTTDEFAIRYAIFLGARSVFTVGIEREPEGAGGPAPTGDASSIPPSDSPIGTTDPNDDISRRRLRALEAVRNDIVNQRLGVGLYNCSTDSRLNSQGILPFADLDRVLGRHRLAAVAMPITPAEVNQVVANLQSWNTPALAPVLPGTDVARIPLVLIFNGRRSASLESRIQEVFKKGKILREAFSELRFEYCGLEGERDRYERTFANPPGRFGYKAGPNHMFFAAMRFLARHGRYSLLMESDCFPLRPHWLGELHRLVEGAEPFWVMGSIYRGSKDLAPPLRRHINGNAVYAAGDPAFRAFLEDTWLPAIEGRLASNPMVAYDVALALHFDMVGQNPHPSRMFKSIATRFRYTDYIQNISADDDVAGEAGDRRRLLRDSPHTYLVHGRHFAPSVAKVRPASSTPSHHGLQARPFDAVVVHQMGKVGSTSLHLALERLEKWPVFQTHVLHPGEPYFAPGGESVIPPNHLRVPDHVLRSIELRADFLETGRPVAVITPVREPIARNVSAFFQNIRGFIHGSGVAIDDPVSLLELFLRKWGHREPDQWFERQLNDVFEVDVFAQPFPEKQWTVIDSKFGSILVLRASLDDTIKADLVAEFLELDSLELGRLNVTEANPNAVAYSRFKALVAKTDYIDEMLTLRMAQHFFSAAEREEIRTGWRALGET